MSPAHRPFERSMRIRPGFSPAALAPAVAPVPGVRPWYSVADADPSYVARFRAGHGPTPPTTRDVVLAPRPVSEVVAGFLHQEVYFDLTGAPGARLRLSLRAADEPAPPAPFPFAGPIAIIGTTIPGHGAGRPEDLSDYLAGRGVESWGGTAADPARDWVDDVLLAAGTDGAAAAAAAHWQRFLTVWRPDAEHPTGMLEVRDTDDEVVAAGPAELRAVDIRTCPMVPGAGHGALCEMFGGPWVTRSIRGAARWETRRARMVRGLGCDACGDGRIKLFMGHRVLAGGLRSTGLVAPERGPATRYDAWAGVPDEE